MAGLQEHIYVDAKLHHPPDAMSKLNWDRRRQQALVKRPVGITNGQQRDLARLRRKLGERYEGNDGGMTTVQAQRAIADAKRRLAPPPVAQKQGSRAQFAKREQQRLRAAFLARQKERGM